jgi:hypothetical protein
VARGSPSWWRSTSPAAAVVAIEHVAVVAELDLAALPAAVARGSPSW